jgi:3-oxoadipate enol-lactonase
MHGLFNLDPNPSGTPAVLFLHGLGANSSSWQLQFPLLIEAGFRPIAPDAPGFGASSYDGKGWSIKRVAAELAGLMDEMHLAQAHLVGISMGGVVAQQFVLDFPERVNKLVLVNTFAVLQPDTIKGWLYFLQRFVLVHTVGLPAQARVVASRLFPGEGQEQLRQLMIEQVTQADPRAYRAAMRSLGLFNSAKRIGQINKPTLVMSGQNDTTVPLRNQRALAIGIAGAQQVIIPNAGHAASVDQPDIFNRVLLEFFCNSNSSGNGVFPCSLSQTR